MQTLLRSNKFSDGKCINFAVNGFSGLTRFVELMPNKNYSISAEFCDILFHGICPGFNPRPGFFVLWASP